jgi:hypothetical protein
MNSFCCETVFTSIMKITNPRNDIPVRPAFDAAQGGQELQCRPAHAGRHGDSGGELAR